MPDIPQPAEPLDEQEMGELERITFGLAVDDPRLAVMMETGMEPGTSMVIVLNRPGSSSGIMLEKKAMIAAGGTAAAIVACAAAGLTAGAVALIKFIASR